jgi:hypothetical protein
MDADRIVTAAFAVRAGFDLEPRRLDLDSRGGWVRGDLELPAPYDVSQVYIASILLNGLVPASADGPGRSRVRGHRLELRFPRALVARALAPGDRVPVTVTGIVAGQRFEGVDSVRVEPHRARRE